MAKALIVAAALAFAAGPAATALACEGRKILFEDKFTDDSGGWYMNEHTRLADSSFFMKVAPNGAFRVLNVSFSFTDADICIDTAWAQGAPAQSRVGLMFWAQDYANYFLLTIGDDGTFGIMRRQGGRGLV